MLIYLLNDSKLPWSRTAYQEVLEHIPIMERLKIKTTEESINELFDQTPTKLQKPLYKLISADFDQEPDYDNILSCLEECFHEAIQGVT